jgi:DNA mismatch endonuclease (patch repair protein)
MRNTRQRDTPAEVALRSALHRRGLRFFVDRPPLRGLRRRADLVFPRARVAVYVDGCFWHGCPKHATWPKANADWWRDKLQGNQERDRDTDRRLGEAGWTVVRIWEHEDPVQAADRVAAAVQRRAIQESPRRPARLKTTIPVR